MKMVVAAVALVVTAGACQPGWVNAMIGSGDGSGTAPGTVGEPYRGAALQQPTAVASAPDGSVYVYDAARCAVYRQSGTTLSLYAGTPGSCGNSGNGGPATSAQIDAEIPANFDAGMPQMYAMAVDGSGNLYFFGESNWTLRRVDATTGEITATSIPHEAGEYALPGVSGLATDRDGSIIVLVWTFRYQGPRYDKPTSADVLRFDAGSFTTVASWDMSTLADHPPTEAASGLAVLPDGSYLTTTGMADSLHLFRIDPSTGTAADVASNIGGSSPWVVTTDALGNAYVPAGNQIIRVGPDGSSSVIAGSGAPDPGTTRQFGIGNDLNFTPLGLAITRNGNLLFSSGHTVYHLHDPANVQSIASAE
jgi:streptogramin lyase